MKTKDKSTNIVVTTTKTVSFKVKGIVIEMTVQELEDMYQKLHAALGKPPPQNMMEVYEKARKAAERDRPRWDRPHYPPPPMELAPHPRLGYFQPDVICKTSDSSVSS